DDTRDDRPFVQVQAETMRKLQAERRHFIREAEFVGLRKDLANMCSACAGFDAGDGIVQPFARLLVGVMLRRRCTYDIEGAVVASAIAHERLQDVKERLITRADHAVSEI